MQEIDLILHQRNQWRNDQSQVFQVKSTELVTEAFAAAGRKNGERRFPFQDFADDRLLAFAKSIKTKDIFQRRVNGAMRRIHSRSSSFRNLIQLSRNMF